MIELLGEFLESSQGQPTTAHYCSTGSPSFGKSSWSVSIQESSVPYRGYYDLPYMRRIEMIQLPSSSSSINHQSLSVDFLMSPLSDDQISAN